MSDATYAAARAEYGDAGVVDIVNQVATYLTAAVQLNAYQAQGPQPSGPSVPVSPNPPVVPAGYQSDRLPYLDISTATPAQQEFYNKIITAAVPVQTALGVELVTSDGKLLGPLNSFLYNPVIGEKFFTLVNASSQSSLSPRVREIVILAVGGEWGADYENYAHAAFARIFGVSDETITSLVAGQAPVGLTGNELIAAQFAQELVSTHHVSDATYHAAEAAFGQAGVVDIVNQVATYLTAAVQLNAYQLPAPPTQDGSV